MTVAYYNSDENAVDINSGRGYTRDGIIKPDFAAPGVEVTSILPGGRFVKRSGTSLAAAQTAGAAALLLEWAAVKGNSPFLNGKSIKNYFIRAAGRSTGRQYPNPEWGYGKLNLYGTFEVLP